MFISLETKKLTVARACEAVCGQVIVNCMLNILFPLFINLRLSSAIMDSGDILFYFQNFFYKYRHKKCIYGTFVSE